jgi:glycosyltransferase involved in cell wall biosynthesis
VDPTVSVIIPTYNRAQRVDKAIRSVLPQVRPGDEVIVIDDGSTDDTKSVLRRFAGRITVLSGDHGGAGRARNLGLERARGDLVAFLDSDDKWLPGKLMAQRRLMGERPDIMYCFTNFAVRTRESELIHHYLDRWPRQSRTWEQVFGPGVSYSSQAPLPRELCDFRVYWGDMYRWQLTGLYVLTDTVMVRRKEAGAALRFAEDLPTYEDLECFCRLAQAGSAAYLDIETAVQRDHEDGRLSQVDQRKRIDARLVLTERIWGQDSWFLARHGDLYRQTCDALRLEKVRLLLWSGLNREARRVIGRMHEVSPSIEFLARLPAPMSKSLLVMRQALRARRSS